jgi:AcrR family transcriptional regulator
MRTRSVGRRQEILDAAQALLIGEGYERMTIKKVAERAGAAVGSITHFYNTKQTLAAAVAKDLIDKLAADAEAALKGHDTDVGRAVQSIVGACSNWPQKFRRYRDLVVYVEFGQRVLEGERPDSLQGRLERVLASWARTLIQNGKIAPLTSAQLYDVIIAPAICDVRFPVTRPSTKSNIDWIDLLSRAALVALQPPETKSGRKGKVEPAIGSPP